VYVSGRVQGVYYRATTRDTARGRGIDGWGPQPRRRARRGRLRGTGGRGPRDGRVVRDGEFGGRCRRRWRDVRGAGGTGRVRSAVV